MQASVRKDSCMQRGKVKLTSRLKSLTPGVLKNTWREVE